MNTFVFFAMFVVLSSCGNSSNKSQNPNSLNVDDTTRNIEVEKSEIKPYINIEFEQDSTRTYLEMKYEVQKIKKSVNSDSISNDSLSKLFIEIIVNKIIPYWYGTPWDFYGYTATPNSGKIACGYFVSTTLQDAGINIDRYKLAQQFPINEALSLALSSELIHINTFDQSESEIYDALQDTLKLGLYFIGFDQGHVGFLLNNGDQIYLIHSNYLENRVLIERIENSLVFPNYSIFIFAEISTNIEFLEKWLEGSSFEIVK